MKRREFVKTISAAGAAMLLRPTPSSLFAQEAPADPAVKRVLVMFKCHFDAGFVDTQANVVHKYFNEYFPRPLRSPAPRMPAANGAMCGPPVRGCSTNI